MHDASPGLFLLGLVVVLSVFLVDVAIDSWGAFQFIGELNLYLVVPLLASLSAALFVHYRGPIVVLRSPGLIYRYIFCRGLWFCLVILTVIVTCSGPVAAVGGKGATAVVSNCLLFCALSTGTATLGRLEACWVPGVSLLLLAMLAGYEQGSGSDEYYWWASFMKAEASPMRLLFCVALILVALGIYLFKGKPRTVPVGI